MRRCCDNFRTMSFSNISHEQYVIESIELLLLIYMFFDEKFRIFNEFVRHEDNWHTPLAILLVTLLLYVNYTPLAIMLVTLLLYVNWLILHVLDLYDYLIYNLINIVYST